MLILIVSYLIILFYLFVAGDPAINKCIKREAHSIMNNLLYRIECTNDQVDFMLLTFEASDFIRDYKKHLPKHIAARFKAELNAAIKNKQHGKKITNAC